MTVIKSLSTDKIVKVSTSIEQTSSTLQVDFGVGLFITLDDGLGTEANRIKSFSSFDDVADTFDVGSQPYNAGLAWFSQTPGPKNIIIGRWYQSDTTAKLFGGVVTASVSDFSDLGATGYIAIGIDGVNYDVNVDLTTVVSYSEVATAIEASLVTVGAPVTVIYDAVKKIFVFETTTVGSSATLSYTQAPVTGIDLGVLVRATADSLSRLDEGQNAETLTDAVIAIKNLNPGFYMVSLDNSVSNYAYIQELAQYIETQRLVYFAQSNDPTMLTLGETTSIAYALYEAQLQRTTMTYTAQDDYKCLSIAAAFSSVNYDANSDVITAKFKTLYGLTPDSFTDSDYQALESKRVNFYAQYSSNLVGGEALYAEGYCFNNNVYIDVIIALDWFNNAVQTSVIQTLKSSKKVAQTESGEAIIVASIDSVCQKAISNGMIAGGFVTDVLKNNIISVTGNQNFDGNLIRGYLIYSSPTALQSPADRAARKATEKYVWLKGSGAIHSVDIIVTFEN
jgi:hypothetical protein